MTNQENKSAAEYNEESDWVPLKGEPVLCDTCGQTVVLDCHKSCGCLNILEKLQSEIAALHEELEKSEKLAQRLIHTNELEREAIFQYRLQVGSNPNLPHWDSSDWSNLEWVQEQIKAWQRTRESKDALLASNVELTAEVSRLRETAWFYARSSDYWDRPNSLKGNEAREALSQPSPTGFGDKLMQLVKAARAWSKGYKEYAPGCWRRDPMLALRLNNAAKDFTPEEIKILENYDATKP